MNKKIIYSVLFTLMLAVIIVPFGVSAQVDGFGGLHGGGGGGGNTLQAIVDALAKNLKGLATGLATIAFIVAGVMFLSATGNPSRMTIAKGSLVAGIIGIIIILLASGASSFVKTLFGL